MPRRTPRASRRRPGPHSPGERRPGGCAAEALESRRLLTFAVSGTPGPDLIEMFQDGTAYRVQVNGQSAGLTTESDITVSGLAGNDTIVPVNVRSGMSITIQGGFGDDTVRVGTGHLAVHLQGQVFIRELPGEGNDQIVIDDTLDNADTERDFTVAADTLGGLTHRFTSGLGAPPRSVHFDANTESIGMSASNADDTIHVIHGMPQGLSMSLGGGNDEVVYGGLYQVVPDLPPATLDGGEGFDDLVFNDRSGPAGGRVYAGGESRFLNQNLTGFENLTLTPRDRRGDGPEHELTFAGGFPVGDNITVETIFGFNQVERVTIGTFADRIDLDSQDLILTLRNRGLVEIEDQDLDSTGAPFELWTSGSNTQHIDKGGFRLACESPAPTADIKSHSPGEYAVSRVHPESRITISGSTGDDSLYTANRNGHDNDIDAVFPFSDDNGGHLSFFGNQGDDQLDLDDSADQAGDGDANYFLANGPTGESNLFRKGPAGDGSDLPTLVEFYSIERVAVVGDSDGNLIHFSDQVGTRLALNGGPGNDTFTNHSPLGGDLRFDASGGALIGGPGNDLAALYDSRFGSVGLAAAEYTFAPGNFSYLVDGFTRTFAYDDSLESLSLDESDNPATVTRLDGKLPALRLSVAGLGGNDTFIVGGGDIDASGFSTSTTTLLGGTGDDQIVFDDQLDDHGPADRDELDLYFGQIVKDGVSLSHAGFESQKLKTSRVNTSGVASPNKIRIHAIDIATEVTGQAGNRDNVVDVGNIGQVFAPITLSFDEANVAASVFDPLPNSGRAYQFSATRMSGPVVINYSGVEDMYVYAGTGSDTLDVGGTPAGLNLFFNGGDGDEMMSLGSAAGPLSDLAGRVFANGGNGVDRLFFSNGAGGGFTDGTLTSGSFRANGGPNHLLSAVEALQVLLNDDGSNINVTSLSVSTGIHGGSGDDRVTVGGGDLDVNIRAPIFVQGAGGSDRVVVDDRNGTNQPGTPAEYAFDVFVGTAGPVGRLYPNPPSVSGFFITCLGVEHRQFDASNDPNHVNVIDTIAALSINSNGGNDVVNVTDAAGLLTVHTGSGDDSLTINSDSGTSGDGPVTVQVDRSDEVNMLRVRPGGLLRVASGAVLTASPATGFALDGVIDLSGGGLVLRDASGRLDAVNALAKGGNNGGAWDGTVSVGDLGGGAINSSLAASSPALDAVGLAPASQLFSSFPAAFLGQTVNANDLVMTHTLSGDWNLDKVVDVADLGQLATNYGRTGRRWNEGDATFDGVVDVADLGQLATNYGRSIEAAPAPLSAAATAAPRRRARRQASRSAGDVLGT